MDKVNGYILLFKQIQDNWLWTDKPFAKGQAWIDLLLMANYADGEMVSKGTLVEIKRGQVFRTVKFLSDRWGWGIKKTKLFLKLLETQKMVTLEGLSNGTRITIEKYDDFQLEGLPNGLSNAHQRDYAWTMDGPQKNKEKERIIKKDKDIYSRAAVEIIGYLNEICGTEYKPNAKETKRLIRARMNDGFTVEDFKTVIFKKAKQWKDDPKMCAFLRPQTLFGTKFESYLNEKMALTFEERLKMA